MSAEKTFKQSMKSIQKLVALIPASVGEAAIYKVYYEVEKEVFGFIERGVNVERNRCANVARKHGSEAAEREILG